MIGRTLWMLLLMAWGIDLISYSFHYACDIFTIPIMIVASEPTFSIGGRGLDQYNSSLKPEIVEVIVQ